MIYTLPGFSRLFSPLFTSQLSPTGTGRSKKAFLSLPLPSGFQLCRVQNLFLFLVLHGDLNCHFHLPTSLLFSSRQAEQGVKANNLLELFYSRRFIPSSLAFECQILWFGFEVGRKQPLNVQLEVYVSLEASSKL